MVASPRVLRGPISVLGTGRAFPGPPVDIAGMVRFVGLVESDHIAGFVGQIAEQLDCRQRFLARDLAAPRELPRPGDSNPELSARAVRAALEDAGRTMADVDLLIGHTTSPHTLLPPNIAWVADELEWDGHFMELRQACTGFANALMIASPMLRTGAAECVVIVGSETGSTILDLESVRSDRGQLVNLAQMGDGAGAVVLGRHEEHGGPVIDNVYFGGIGQGKASGFSLAVGGSGMPAHSMTAGAGAGFHNDYRLARDEGLALFSAGFETLDSLGYGRERIARYLSHQANGRMADVLSPLLGVPHEKFHNCAVDYGNTGSASTWIGLDAVRKGGWLSEGEVLGVLGAEATKFMYGGFTYTHTSDPAVATAESVA